MIPAEAPHCKYLSQTRCSAADRHPGCYRHHRDCWICSWYFYFSIPWCTVLSGIGCAECLYIFLGDLMFALVIFNIFRLNSCAYYSPDIGICQLNSVFPIFHNCDILYMLSHPTLATGRGCRVEFINFVFSLRYGKHSCLLCLQMARRWRLRQLA